MNELFECEPEGTTRRYNVIARDETEALNKIRNALDLDYDASIKIKRKEYLGWIIF